MMHTLKNKRGMTLIELMVGMLIFSIIAISVTAILVPTLKSFHRANELAEVNTLLDTVANEVNGTLSKADDVSFTAFGVDVKSNNGTTKYTVQLGDVLTEKGLLYRDTHLFLDERYYSGNLVDEEAATNYTGKTISLEFFGVSPDGTGAKGSKLAPGTPAPESFYMTITIWNPDGSLFISRDYALRPLGLKNDATD